MNARALARRPRSPRPPAHQPGVSRWARCGDWPVHYREQGDGPPVLLLHGLGGSSRYWAAVAARLATDHRLIMPDLLGFGDSGKPYVAYTPALHCRALAAVLAAAAPGQPVSIIGHSLGAVLAVELAGRLPAAAARLALVTPAFPTGPDRMRAEVRRLSAVNRFLLSCVPVTRLTHAGMQAVWPAVCRIRPPKALFSPDLLAEYGKYTYHAYMSTLNRCLFDHDLRPSLGRLDGTPTLVLAADGDRHVPPHHGPDLAAGLPGAHLVRLPSHHHPALSHPALLADHLRAWLNDAMGDE